MKILIVSMVNSIHTVRWVKMISDQGWDIHIFPASIFAAVHPELIAQKNLNIHSSKLLNFFIGKYKAKKRNTQNMEANLGNILEKDSRSNISWRDIARKVIPDKRVNSLVKLIKKIKPDLVHAMHVQEGGYLALEARKILKDNFPKWLVTNWGSELNLFSKISSEESKIKEVLQNCDILSGECAGDIKIARGLGFKGKFLHPIIPNSGGIDFDFINKIKKPGKTSERKTIMLKGYQNWAGRALVGLRALERCADMLKGYRIVIYCIDSLEVAISAELFTKKTNIPVELIPLETPHLTILDYHGNSRISIGLSITDAISTSLLEAMAMGSFPIQSNTSCANEWLKDGQAGILVNPEDPEDTEKALRRALADDGLVDNAAKLNYNMLYEKLKYEDVKKIVIQNYKNMVSGDI